MSTVKFSKHDKLKELQAKIYLETKITLTQQQLLDMGVDILSENIELVINRISKGGKKIDKKHQDEIFDLISDWGEGTEDSSETIDEVLYG
jgi:hypothetical protein